MKKFHINKHGVPAACNSPIDSCPYRDERHFRSYEEAKLQVEETNSNFEKGMSLYTNNPIKKIKSYFQSLSAVNAFPINKKISEVDDFELIMLSWLSNPSVEKGMKRNEIGEAKFTYGDIVRVLDFNLKKENGVGLDLESKYYNPIPFDCWEDQMKTQKRLYEDSSQLANALSFDSMEVVSLPMSAREHLKTDGYLSNPKSIHEVIYRVRPHISHRGDVISYNHSTKQINKEFDIYQVAGAVEGQTLHDLCYSSNLEDEFRALWQSNVASKREMDYERLVERYRKEQFFRGLEGTMIPKAFVNMSPIVAQEISNFIELFRAIVIQVESQLKSEGLSYVIDEQEKDDGDWIIF